MLSYLSLGAKKMAKKKDIKQEQNVEMSIQDPIEEQKKLDESLDLIPLCREKSEVPFDVAIENERKNIFTVYRKARTESNIVMVVTVVLLVASLVIFTQAPAWGDWCKIVGGVIMGGVFVFMLVHFFLTKNKFPNTTKKYIRYFITTMDNYLFDVEDVHDQKLYYEKRYVAADVIADRCYKEVVDIASRNLVTATYKEKPFEFGELALYKAGAKKYQKTVMFVGKYLTIENSRHFEGRYIIRIKAAKEVDTPNDIDDLAILSEQNNFVIYGPEGADFNKDLGKDLIDNLKAIDCVGALLNVNIVLWAGRTAVYLSYDDSIIAIPFDKAIVPESYHQLKKNFKDVLEILVD